MKFRVLLVIALCAPMALAQRAQKNANSFPEIDQLMQSRESGLVTDWNLIGPFGKHAQADFLRSWSPEQNKDEKHSAKRQGAPLRFANGQFKLPANTGNGVYYASSSVYLFSDGDWNVWVESANAIEVFVDGEPVLLRKGAEQDSMRAVHESVHLSRGRHTILTKFVPEASPFRVAVMPPSGGIRQKRNIPLHELAPESLVLSASLR